MHATSTTRRGRGTATNPPNRFTPLHYVPDPDSDPAEELAPTTQLFSDTTRAILAHNTSPDIGFDTRWIRIPKGILAPGPRAHNSANRSFRAPRRRWVRQWSRRARRGPRAAGCC